MPTTTIADVQAIDVHCHFGVYREEPKGSRQPYMGGDGDLVVRRARMANTRLSITSPLTGLMPRGNGDPVEGNKEALAVVGSTEGLLQYVIIDPLKPETFDQAEEMLATPKCVGIKIHPEEHLYPIKEHGEKIFEFAARHRAVVDTHSGETNSVPEDFVEFADAFPEAQIIISHLGCGWDEGLPHQVRAIQMSKHGNLYTDTSSMMSVTAGLLELAVKEIGADRILYGTDSPLYFAPMQRARVDHAEIGDDDKRKILCENATKLFGF